MSHHIYTSGGAAHEIIPSVAPVLVSTASRNAFINDSGNTDEDTTATAEPLISPPLWSCEDPLPVGPFRSQEQAVLTVKQFALSQVFAVSISRTRSRGIKRVHLSCLQGKEYRGFHKRLMSLRDRGTKKVGCSYELAITFDKKLPEDRAWSTICLNNCHTGHSRCITKTMLSSQPAARRVKGRRQYGGHGRPDASVWSCSTGMCAYVVI